MKRFMVAACICVMPAALSGCAGFQAGISAASMQAPGVLGEVETTKAALATAPLAGCVMVVQQAGMLLNALKSGSPGIPVAIAPVPPVITAPK